MQIIIYIHNILYDVGHGGSVISVYILYCSAVILTLHTIKIIYLFKEIKSLFNICSGLIFDPNRGQCGWSDQTDR